jgi:erythromycin esterase
MHFMCSLQRKKAGSFESGAVRYIKEHVQPLASKADLDPLMERIGNAKIVMLGEASHGTHEYYTWRTLISKRLIEEKHFNFIAVEGDWPDAYQLNRYIKNYSETESSAADVLKTFDRWPVWMWGNWEVVALAEWLKRYNETKADNPVGFYGLDVYSLWDSLVSILQYLEKTDPSALPAAEKAFRCFEPYKTDDGSAYTYSSSLIPGPCEEDVLKLLQDIQLRIPHHPDDFENAFSAEQNAYIAVNAERYYRSMIKGMTESWNVRDSHMFESLLRLLEFHGEGSKAIIWEHNTHIGDARASDMADEGMFNIGELARKHFPAEEVVLVGFGSYEGTVVASYKWGGEMKKIEMPPATKDSWESLLHQASAGNKLLMMDDFKHPLFLQHRIGHRAIGVVYEPAFERYGNYVPSILPERYDAFLFLNSTSALHPLHLHPKGNEMPDTFPFGV